MAVGYLRPQFVQKVHGTESRPETQRVQILVYSLFVIIPGFFLPAKGNQRFHDKRFPFRQGLHAGSVPPQLFQLQMILIRPEQFGSVIHAAAEQVLISPVFLRYPDEAGLVRQEFSRVAVACVQI